MELVYIAIYGIAFIAILYYMTRRITPMNTPLEKATTAVVGEPRDSDSALMWPWTITNYSHWNAWMTPRTEEYHHGKYGYTGRQNLETQHTVFGDHYGWRGDGGNMDGGKSNHA